MVAEILDQILSYRFYLITKRQNLFFLYYFHTEKSSGKVHLFSVNNCWCAGVYLQCMITLCSILKNLNVGKNYRLLLTTGHLISDLQDRLLLEHTVIRF